MIFLLQCITIDFEYKLELIWLHKLFYRGIPILTQSMFCSHAEYVYCSSGGSRPSPVPPSHHLCFSMEIYISLLGEGSRGRRDDEKKRGCSVLLPLLPSPRRDRSPSRSRGGEKEEQEMALIRQTNSKYTLHENKTYSA